MSHGPSRPHRFAPLGVLGLVGLCSCLACRETVYAVPAEEPAEPALLLDPGLPDRTWLRRTGIPLRFAADEAAELRGHLCCEAPANVR
jgi:hypothetical protein